MGNMYLPMLAAELPTGWTVSEGSTFVSPSGTEIHARVTRAPDGLEATDLIEREASSLPVDTEPETEVPSSTIRVNGKRIVAQQRRFTFHRDGVPCAGRIICAIDDGLALIITASWRATNVGADSEVDEVAAGIRILNRPIASFEAAPDSAVRTPQARRSPPDGSAWSALRATWAAPIDADEEMGSVARWSPQELAVCALTLNSSTFPTVGVEEFAGLPQMAMQVTLETVMRSFIARGLVRAHDDGSVALVDELHSMVDTAVFPDLTVLAEHMGTGGITVTWFGVRPDRAVRVSVIPDGSRECGEITPSHLIGNLWNLAGTGSEEMVAGATDQQRSVTLEDLIERRFEVASLLRVTTAWRVGDAIHGGIAAWAVGTSGELWLADEHAVSANGALSWDLRSGDAEAIRNQLLDNLPGG